MGGGAGIVPLRAMVRHRLALGADVETSVVDLRAHARGAAVRATRSTPWPAAGVRTHVTFTREGGRGSTPRQLAAAGPARHVFVCGPTAFVEHATRVLLEVGHEAANVRAERFGGAT